MDVKWAAVILLWGFGTGRTDAAEKIPVDVYVQSDNWSQSMRNAKALVSRIFGRIDVSVIWHTGESPAVLNAGRRAIGIRLVERAPHSVAPRALASARPFGSSGSLITVYEDRVQSLVTHFPSLSHVLLGYIFAHELAHMMQGIDDHSDSGILKAHWSNADFSAMHHREWAFSDCDVDRIRDGLAVGLSARQAK